jgi:putative membrane protein
MTAGDDGRVPVAGLQPERTSLAWRRLALVLLGLALVVPRLGWSVIGVWTLLPTGIVAAGALGLMAASHRRYVDTHGSLADGSPRPLPDGRLPMITVLTALTLAAVGAVILATRFT